MTRTHEKVSPLPAGKLEGASSSGYTRETAADGVEQAKKLFEGRWKLVILFHLFGGRVLRFSDLERAIPAISQKMLAQQLRQLQSDGLVHRTVHQQVPPKVEYALTEWGQALCPALDSMLTWLTSRPETEKQV
ncbi:winged helix-turn-helix transcriptional regulator [Dongia rigui]|uniref:Helix-turn-helix domain-containing protein n=1 Tax=Dongia rigui TaxID=940149 RepID=A0ABU5DV46_9PROT|nr:helix-turn-helix domain-containing protein [Dongia rigui]MDY0871199.1 helix-turn-helix domain-containing protein [Dongia rigui]